MNQLRELTEKEKNQYQKGATHFTQSWEWGEFREKTGVKVHRFGEFEGPKLTSAWQIFFHKIPKTNFTVGYLPRTEILNKNVLEYLKEIGQKNNCIFIKLEPDVYHPQSSSSSPSPQFSQSSQFSQSRPILPTHTFLLDLTQTEESILKNMHEKTRYNIRLAQKQGVEVKEKDDEKSLEIFLDFLEETERRQGFYSHPKSYFRKQWEILKPAGMIHLLLAYFDNQPISGILLLRFKDSLSYAYGGSSEIHRDKMPNHLLHWEAIKLGKKLSCNTYDFWGSYLEKPEPSDPWYGIYRFKVGFGGEPVSYVDAYDLIFNPFLYQLYKIIDWLRWKFLRLKQLSNN